MVKSRMDEDTVKTLEIESIDQILEKIKKAINTEPQAAGGNSPTVNETSDILELTNVVTKTKDKNLDPLSQPVQDFTRKLHLLMQGNYVSEKEIREIFKETLRPYLKSWLNNNIKLVAKEVLESEVKKLLEKMI